MKRTVLLLAVGLLFAAAAQAAPLLPDELLRASARHVPMILEQRAEVDAALSTVINRQGAFDTELFGDGATYADGFYNGRSLETGFRRPLRRLGGQLYGSYAASRGDFPIYEDDRYKSTDGGLKLGILLPLLQDRQVDRRRVDLWDARQAVREKELQALLTLVEVQRDALHAYWDWVSAGHTRDVYRSLLNLAQQRDDGMRRQVEDGSLAAIVLTENAQNITRRESLLLEAERRYTTASLALSFYLRDVQGNTLTPPEERALPLDLFAELPQASATRVPASAAARRPELHALDVAITRAEQRIRQSENQLLPSLDLKLQYGYGLGSAGEGGPSRDTEEATVALSFSVPLERRSARGSLSRARAERQALSHRRRHTEERIVLEIQRILLELDIARRQADLAQREMTQAEQLRDAEVRRFEQGASNFFLVNLREKAAADARILYLESLKAAHKSRADYDAVTVNETNLRL